MRNLITRFAQDESGASLVEYGLLLALIAIVCLGAITALGANVNTVFTNISNAIAAAL